MTNPVCEASATICVDTANVRGMDVPPPGAGLTTVTESLAGAATSAAVMDAVSCVELTKVVVRLLPFHCAVEAATKLLPLTVKVKAGPLMIAVDGDRELTRGTGLATEILAVAEVPPPGAGLKTLRATVPAFAMSAAVIDAVSCVALK